MITHTHAAYPELFVDIEDVPHLVHDVDSAVEARVLRRRQVKDVLLLVQDATLIQQFRNLFGVFLQEGRPA